MKLGLAKLFLVFGFLALGVIAIPVNGFAKSNPPTVAVSYIDETIDLLDQIIAEIDRNYYRDYEVVSDRFLYRIYDLDYELYQVRQNLILTGDEKIARLSLEGALHEVGQVRENYARLLTHVGSSRDTKDLQELYRFYEESIILVYETDPLAPRSSVYQTAPEGTHQTKLLQESLEDLVTYGDQLAIGFPQSAVLIRRMKTRAVELHDEIYTYVYLKLLQSDVKAARNNFPGSQHELNGLDENYTKVVNSLPATERLILDGYYRAVVSIYEKLQRYFFK